MEKKDTNKVINQAVTNLFEEIKAGKSDRLLKYLEFCSKFHNYSMGNTFLILMQCKHASKVAGYKQLQELGYQVNKGEKAIKILAPNSYTYIEEDGKAIFYTQMSAKQRANKEEHKSGITFKAVSVFDISQCTKFTDNNDTVEHYFYAVGNDFKDSYFHLKGIIEASNIKVIETDTGVAEGISFGGKIHIKKELEFNNKVLTILHEWAHELLHAGSENKTFSRPVKECQAEATSFIVSQFLGLKNPFSSDYILNWVESSEELKNQLTTILEASNQIIEKIKESEVKNECN